MKPNQLAHKFKLVENEANNVYPTQHNTHNHNTKNLMDMPTRKLEPNAEQEELQQIGSNKIQA